MVASSTYVLAEGINIYFSDSRAPPSSSDYTTLIILHGSAFNGECFEKIHTFSHEYNLRTVIWNRREYPGSTKYTDAEIQDLHHGRKVFLDRLAIQVGDFVRQFVEREGIPKISEDRKTGGFAILGWSMGTATAMPLFSDKSLFSKKTYALLESYVKDLILDDPPHLSFGIDLPRDAKVYNPWADPDYKTPEELYQNFTFWVSSYYDHPDFHAASLPDLDFHKRTDHTTIASWTPAQFQRFYTQSAATRSELPMYAQSMQPTLNDLAQRVLYDGRLTETFFPKVPVTYISATRTNWQCAWGYLKTKGRYEEEVAKGHKVRNMRFFVVEGGNHFVRMVRS
ncbi:hypothetical protein C0992_008439 [Termitomyces sp. T32_za158]|nr:hypothetical protein C0992_008439 [Termitomyces sp. T32_za158]